MAHIKKTFPHVELIKNTPAINTLIYVGEITDDVQIIVDAGSKMFECWIPEWEIEEEFYADPYDDFITYERLWKNDPSFLKTMVLNNIQLVEELPE